MKAGSGNGQGGYYVLRIWTCQLQSYPSSYHPHGMCNRCLFLSDRNIYLRVYLRNSISQSSPNPIQLLPPLSQPGQLSNSSLETREREREERKRKEFNFFLPFNFRISKSKVQVQVENPWQPRLFAQTRACTTGQKYIQRLSGSPPPSCLLFSVCYSFESADHKMYHLLVCTPRVKLDFIGTVIHSTLPSESTSGRSNHDSSSSPSLLLVRPQRGKIRIHSDETADAVDRYRSTYPKG